MCNSGKPVRFYAGSLGPTEKLDTPVVSSNATMTRQLTLQLLRDGTPFKTSSLGSNITLFVKVPASECVWSKAYLGLKGDKRDVIRQLRKAAVMARQCINHHGITGDPASVELDAAIEASEPFV